LDRVENKKRGVQMKKNISISIILLFSLLTIVLLICWSMVGPVLGGSSFGGGDGGEPPDGGEGEGEAESEAEAEGAESESESEAEAESEAESESESESESEAESESEEERDSDHDFIPDSEEPKHITDMFDWDCDDDHLRDGVENGITDPNIQDTDNDGF
jgi:hypothetical protein